MNHPDVELVLVNTLFQKADVFTKAVAGSVWENAMKLLNTLKTYDILHTSSTGHKMSLEHALAPDVGEGCQVKPSKAPAKVKKQKARNRPTGGFHNTKKPLRTATLAICLSNDPSCMFPSTEVMVGQCHFWSGVRERKLVEWTPARCVFMSHSGTKTDPAILLLPMTVRCTLHYVMAFTTWNRLSNMLSRAITCSYPLHFALKKGMPKHRLEG